VQLTVGFDLDMTLIDTRPGVHRTTVRLSVFANTAYTGNAGYSYRLDISRPTLNDTTTTQ